ncbi:MAG: NAD(P)-binding protein, partial [Nocardioides sp.]
MAQAPATASRRTVVAALGAGTLTRLRAPGPSSRRGDPVVVVGAGMAGITAADRLRRAGYDVR